jgi:single-strand DNA-binding protein
MANDLNSVTIVGRLTRDVELKYSTSGTAIARLSLGTTQNRKQGDQWVEESHYFTAIMFGRRADALQRYLTKGQQVGIIGTLQQNRWQDKQTGQNRSQVQILIDDIQLLGGKGNQAGGGQNQNSQSPVDDGFDDDIPF